MIDVYLAQDDGTILVQDDGTPVIAYSYRQMPPAAPAYTADVFKGALLALLPTGAVWPRENGAVLPEVVSGLAPAFARFTDRSAALLQDAPAGALTEQLDVWETTLGLPDPCAGAEPTIALRRQQVQARISARGGQSKHYFINVAAALGFTITIEEFAPRRFGRPFGQRYGGIELAHTWKVHAPAFVTVPRRFGAPFGERYTSWPARVLECELRRIAPAHTVLLFSYSGAIAAPLDEFDLDRNTLV